jgi:hypothetical protein
VGVAQGVQRGKRMAAEGGVRGAWHSMAMAEGGVHSVNAPGDNAFMQVDSCCCSSTAHRALMARALGAPG